MVKKHLIRQRQYVQPGLGTTNTRSGGELRSMWIEIPACCDLYCSYCFEDTKKYDRDPNNLSIDEYRKLIGEFSYMGGKDIGIPGAGEPFWEDKHVGLSNRELTLSILESCKKHGICLTIFTTGHLINDELAEYLVKYDVVLLIKYNSTIESVQNALVGNVTHVNYTKERDNALFKLIRLGFNKPSFGKSSRLGIVTSVMDANKNELPDMLRFARNQNLIFDCDTILERGRGKTFDDKGGSPDNDEMRQIFRLLQRIDAKEYGNHWDISRSYIGTCCDRFRHHIYVSKIGDVHPCVGATKVYLGNIKETALQECWNTPAMKVIRNHHYAGKCVECLNFIEEKCYSCLGRCTKNLTDVQIVKDGVVQTIGCWNHRPRTRDGA